MSLINLTTSNFENEILKSPQIAIVDFWASWCGPCRMLSPIIDEIADEYNDVVVGKINVDEQEELAFRYKVSSIPTLIVFNKGDIVCRVVGLKSKKDILKLIGK